MRRALLIAAAALLLAPAAARADGSEDAVGGLIYANLSWKGDASGPQDATLMIRHGAVTLFNQTIPDVVCNDGCVIAGKDDLGVMDLDGDGEPEVFVAAGTGGADCCSQMGIYDAQPSGGYGQTVLDSGGGNFGLHDEDDDGVIEISAEDLRFEGEFTDAADSFLPPVIYHFLHQDSKPVVADVTREFPDDVRFNAKAAKFDFRKFHRGQDGAEGYVAAYVADQYLLGRGSAGLRELDRQGRRGVLGDRRDVRAFRRDLLRKLHRFGYR
jgi:hypothetical protein